MQQISATGTVKFLRLSRDPIILTAGCREVGICYTLTISAPSRSAVDIVLLKKSHHEDGCS
jgi:hypothetical protein